MCLADFEDYLKVYNQLLHVYEKPLEWNEKSLINISGAERFSADRSIKEYADRIWNITPLN